MKTGRWFPMFLLLAAAAPGSSLAGEPLLVNLFQPAGSLQTSAEPNSLTTPDGTSIDDVANKPPTMWQKMKNGTSNAWHKTTNVFTPKKKPEPATPITGSRNNPPAKQTSNTSSYDKNKAKAQSSDVRTMGDWMKLQRPETVN